MAILCELLLCSVNVIARNNERAAMEQRVRAWVIKEQMLELKYCIYRQGNSSWRDNVTTNNFSWRSRM